ncbi:hypothetical protein LL240_17300 [Oceanimonas baumannii]|uniref:DUF7079 family protein n=1 Tax=Oceanimonas baumannii TaxID=129578 RepID=UPI001D17F236|nr:hypothetical protein [Oceanimonas baumannii]MCC4266191.1 hypothetical protein [Oceanimonas baumannii]
MNDKALCAALSDLFIDNQIDYDAIATVAKDFTLEHVETVLFEWVAPVCYTNALAPTPSVWSGFEPEQLWSEIVEYRRKLTATGFIGRWISHGRQIYLRHKFAQEWEELAKCIRKVSA